MVIKLVPAESGQELILANLLQLYAHDSSEFYDLDLGADGRFVYKELPLYFQESTRHPFLVRENGQWAGLVLVQRGSQISGSPEVWDVAAGVAESAPRSRFAYGGSSRASRRSASWKRTSRPNPSGSAPSRSLRAG